MKKIRLCGLIIFAILVGGINISSADPATAQSTPTKIVSREGKHIALEFHEASWKVLEDPQAYLDALDRVFETYAELVGGVPEYCRKGEKQRILEVDYYPGGWAVAGQPIRWYSPHVADSLKKQVNEGDPLFGILHEIGHCFDIGPWPWEWEFSANFKLTYVAETLKLGGIGGSVNIKKFEEYFRNKNFEEYFRSKAVERDSEDEKALKQDYLVNCDPPIHKFLLLKNEIGWEPFKKTYRTFLTVPPGKFPPDNNPSIKEVRLALFVHLLSKHSGKDLWEKFERWGFPVTRPQEYKSDLSADAFLDAIAAPSDLFNKVALSPVKVENGKSSFLLEAVCKPKLAYNPAPLEAGVARGLWTHSNSTITYDLDPRYVTFEAIARQGDIGSIVFQVQRDGKTVWQSPVMKEKKVPDQPVRLDIAGAKTLTLIVTDAGDGIGYDSACWADAKFIGSREEVFYLDAIEPALAKQDCSSLRRGVNSDGGAVGTFVFDYFPAFSEGGMKVRAFLNGKSYRLARSSAPGVYRAEISTPPSGKYDVLFEIRYRGAVRRRLHPEMVEVAGE